jgi:long-chain fatty acid transport protein
VNKRGLVVALLSFAVARAANASPTLDLAGAVGGNGGEQGVVSGPSASSTYFNPALLGEASEEALVGFSVMSEQVGMTLDGRRGGDVPLHVGRRDITGPDGTPIPNDVVPTPWLRNGCTAGTEDGTCPAPGFPARPRQAAGSGKKTRTYLVLGIVKHLVKDRFSIGAYGMLPVSSFTTARAFYADEREALFSNSLHPELYGDRMTAISISAGASFKILPELAIGAGLSLGLSNAATSATYVRDSTNYDALLLDNAVTTQVTVSPSVGVRYVPFRALRIGAALLGPESFTVDTTVRATLPSGTESSTTRRNVFDYVPYRLSVGVEGDVLTRGRYTMSVAGSIKYAFWGDYEDRQGTKPSDYGDAFAWTDTMSGALGVRHAYRGVRGFVDGVYVPSPVPEQTGRSNYVDNARVGLSFGADVEVRIGRTRLRPGVQGFVHRLVPRHHRKDDRLVRDELPDDAVLGTTHDPISGASGLQTNNPGWPGFASAGWLWGGALTISVPL